MVVIMKNSASEAEIEAVITNLNAFGFDVHRSSGVSQTVLGAIGVQPEFDHHIIRDLNGVSDVQRVTEPYKLASRAGRDGSSVVDLEGLKIGGNLIAVMAGVGSAGSKERMEVLVKKMAASGASLLRGDTLRPRVSFYDYQRLEEDEIKFMCQAVNQHGLKLVLEADARGWLETVANYADILLVRAHNMQNFELLNALGASDKPVLLERGLAATVEEWLMAAEYVMRSGNMQVILCERGIRTFERATRYTLDLSAVSVAKAKSYLPVFVDPSQAAGIREYVTPLACAAVAAGADGVIADVCDDSPNASERGAQALNTEQFSELITQVRQVARAVGRS